MAFYNNLNTASPIASVEIPPMTDGNFAFFYVRDLAKKDEVKQWLTEGIGQQVVAETPVNGQYVLVTRGDQTNDQLVKALADRGDKLALRPPAKKIQPWKWRGALSIIGHSLNLIGSIMGPKGFSVDVGTHAILNQAANLTNIVFGAEQKDDPHRLVHIKKQINRDLGEYLPPSQLIDVDSQPADAHKDEQPPQNMGQKFDAFMRRNSVTVGEIGLRYLAGILLVFPINRWKNGYTEFKKDKTLGTLFRETRNKDKFIAIAGSWWLAGKTIAFFSKVPDPYDPKPHSKLDTIREKYFFRFSTLTEMAGAGTLAVHKFRNGKIKWPDKFFVPSHMRGKITKDYLTTVGSALFMAAFCARLFAPYGVRQLDMDEAYAHATDTLAKIPPEKLPQLMAESAALIKENLKDEPVDFGQVFTHMMTDMYRYHHIALNDPGGKPAAHSAGISGTNEVLANAANETAAQAEKLFAQTQKKPSDRVATPMSAYAREVLKDSEQETQPGLGV